jgi:hypothetical protein
METGIAMTSRQSPTAARPTIGRTTAESTPRSSRCRGRRTRPARRRDRPRRSRLRTLGCFGGDLEINRIAHRLNTRPENLGLSNPSGYSCGSVAMTG